MIKLHFPIELPLTRPVCLLDIEATGVNPQMDRVLELHVIKHSPSWKVPSDFTLRFNPGVPIPAGSTKIHGLTDADVANHKPFAENARELHEIIKECDIAGFGVSGFDVPILDAEFNRCSIEWVELDQARIFDASVIFKRKEERTLTAALKFFCNEELDNAHNAEADTVAAGRVLAAQIRRYGFQSWDEVAQWSMHGQRADIAGKFTYNADGELVFNFGQSRGTKVADNMGLCDWIMARDFPLETKRFIRRVIYKELL